MCADVHMYLYISVCSDVHVCVYICAVPLESEKKSCMLIWAKYLYTSDKICYSQNIGICTTYITKKLLA